MYNWEMILEDVSFSSVPRREKKMEKNDLPTVNKQF